MGTSRTTTGSLPSKGRPHVLILPKWWPNPNDPQLGDFLRKQALGVALHTRASVVHVHPDPELGAVWEMTEQEEQGLWELRVHYRASTHGLGVLRKSINAIRYWRAANLGMRTVIVRRGAPHLIHVHILVRPALVAFRWAKRLGVPYLLSEQSSEYLDGTYAGKSWLFKTLNQYLFRQAAAITVVSDRLGNGLAELGLCTAHTVVPNVVPGLDRPLPAAGPPDHFLVVADLVDRTKNVSGVINALAEARKETPSLHLTIIGDGPDRSMLETLASRLGLEDEVRFLGRLSNAEVLDHMATAGTVIINSNVETFSVVTGEALAQGKPVIATRCGGPSAFITPENGYLIGVGDTEELASHMVRSYAEHRYFDPEIIRRTVGDRYSPNAVGGAFLRLYQRILHQHD